MSVSGSSTVCGWDHDELSRDVFLEEVSVSGITTVYVVVGLWLNARLHVVFVNAVLTDRQPCISSFSIEI